MFPNLFLCVYFLECGPLSIGPNMIQGSFLNYIGAKIQIHCTSGTATITNTTIIECERSGEWTAVPAGFCEDGKCYFISTLLAHPCGLSCIFIALAVDSSCKLGVIQWILLAF